MRPGAVDSWSWADWTIWRLPDGTGAGAGAREAFEPADDGGRPRSRGGAARRRSRGGLGAGVPGQHPAPAPRSTETTRPRPMRRRSTTRRRRPPATTTSSAAAAASPATEPYSQPRIRRAGDRVAIERAGQTCARPARPAGPRTARPEPAARRQDQGQLGQIGVLRVGRLAGQSGVDGEQGRGDLGRHGFVSSFASQALLSFSIARYSRVPAAVSLIPEHLRQLAVAQAGVELERDDLAVARRQLRQRRAHRGASQRHLGAVLDPGAGDVLRLGHERRQAPAPAQLVQRRIAGDAEQPRPLLAAPAVEGQPAPIGPLERQRGHVLGRGAVAQQRADIREHIVTAGAVQQLEPLPGARRPAVPGCA